MKKMNELYSLIDEGVQIADNIRSQYPNEMMCIREIQAAMFKFSREKEIPKLVGEILEESPEKRYELQRRIIAFTGEGKKLENSLIR
jgi:hypothetical protein